MPPKTCCGVAGDRAICQPTRVAREKNNRTQHFYYVLEGAQAFNQLAVAFDCACCRTVPSPGGVQQLTGRPRPRLPIPRAKTGTLALHMGSAWVLTEAVGSATLEVAARSTQGRGGAQWPSLSPPGTPSRPEPTGAHWGGAGAELKPGGQV